MRMTAHSPQGLLIDLRHFEMRNVALSIPQLGTRKGCGLSQSQKQRRLPADGWDCHLVLSLGGSDMMEDM
jgi:hypothetical protein